MVILSGVTFGQVTTFSYSGTIDSYTVPDGVTSIQIEARGAQGGGGLDGVVGGQGAIMIGTFTVTPGEELQILVGGQGLDGTDNGQQAGGTGGGGSYVVDAADEPMIIAGGGGGAMGRAGMLVDGGAGQITEDGQDGEGAGGAGGVGGNGGETWPWTGWHSGTGGGGFYTDGSANSNGNEAYYGTINGKGIAFLNGGDGGFGGSMGRAGGFGGGGAAGFTGGGGGGYSGGGSGTHDMPAPHSGGGGGSYNDGTDQDNTAGANTGNGLIIITELCELLDITASSSEICFGNPLTLTAAGGGTITWEDGVENGVEFTPGEAGTITYTASSDDEDFCETTIDIVVLELPTVTATVDEDEICAGDSVIFTSGGADTYEWSVEEIADGEYYTPGETATYTVTGTDAEGCENTADVTVTVNELPEVIANASATEICLGESVTLTGSGAETYEWSDPIEDGVVHTPDTDGTETHTVTGTDANGCVNTASIDVTVYEQIEITYVTTDEMMGSDGEINITVTGGNPAYTFDWDNDGTGDFDDLEDLTGLTGGTYIVVVEDDGAICTATETIVVNSQVGIDENIELNVNIYPNPTADQVEIQLNGKFEFTIVSTTGEILQRGVEYNNSTVSLGDYANGMYLIQVVSGGVTKNIKVLKQ